jgi:hypothetical protein
MEPDELQEPGERINSAKEFITCFELKCDLHETTALPLRASARGRPALMIRAYQRTAEVANKLYG